MLEKKEGLNVLFCYKVSRKSKVREGESPIDFIILFIILLVIYCSNR